MLFCCRPAAFGFCGGHDVSIYTSAEAVPTECAPDVDQRGGTMVDVVVLAGAVGHERGWTRGLPQSLLPVPGSTLIETLLSRLSRGLCGAQAICANGHTRLISGSLSGSAGATVLYCEDRLPRGTAGCLKDCAAKLRADTFLLAGGSVWLEDDPLWMLEQHRAQGNALTVFCSPHENVVPVAGRRAFRPVGVYCCDRIVLDHIRPAGYQDLKEQTVPVLRQADLRVGAAVLPNRTCEVVTWPGYLRVLARSLTADLFATQRCNKLAPGCWTGRNVQIAKDARLVGPVFLGDDCQVGKGAVIVGPALFGNNCRIGPKAWGIRVVAHPGAVLPAGSKATDRVLIPAKGARGGWMAPSPVRVLPPEGTLASSPRMDGPLGPEEALVHHQIVKQLANRVSGTEMFT